MGDDRGQALDAARDRDTERYSAQQHAYQRKLHWAKAPIRLLGKVPACLGVGAAISLAFGLVTLLGGSPARWAFGACLWLFIGAWGCVFVLGLLVYLERLACRAILRHAERHGIAVWDDEYS